MGEKNAIKDRLSRQKNKTNTFHNFRVDQIAKQIDDSISLILSIFNAYQCYQTELSNESE